MPRRPVVLIPYFVARWIAQRNGRIDGRKRAPFNIPVDGQLGYPAFVRGQKDEAELYVERVAGYWETLDKAYEERIKDIEGKKLPDARHAEDKAKEELVVAEKLFDDVAEHSGWNTPVFKWVLIGMLAMAEVGLNYEPARGLAPALPDAINLFFAFAISFFFMFLAERAGEAAKQGHVPRAIGWGAPVAVLAIAFGYYRESVAEANMKILVAQGEATGAQGSSSSLMFVSILIALFFGTCSFALGFNAAASHERFDARKRSLKHALKRSERRIFVRQALETRLEQCKARRSAHQARCYHLAGIYINTVQRLSMSYLQHYHREAPPNERFPFPHSELPVAIPSKLLPKDATSNAEDENQ